jgi:bifunctional UDP-N-acetylglucosamine pyrophosphorylase/glucosamine-1-phosphate N-acetyltransferase
MLSNVQAIILAGGICKRFQTGKTKFAEKICGTPMILYPTNLTQSLNMQTTVVLGEQAEQLKKIITEHAPHISFIWQQEALGSGHAVQLTQSVWNKDHILIINGDIPLVTADVIHKLFRQHIKMDADISFITAHAADMDNSQYSRVIIDNNHIKVLKEPASEIESSNQCCISAGIYLAKRTFLEKYIQKISKNETTGQFYLPELIHIASEHHCKIITTQVSLDIVRSIETLADLWAVEHIKRSELLRHWMDHGVRFANTLTVQLDSTVRIAPGVHVGTGALLLADTTIKRGAVIGAYAHIQDSIIEEDVVIPEHIIITNSIITKSMNLKPFTHIQDLSPKSKQDLVFTGALKTGFQDQQNF